MRVRLELESRDELRFMTTRSSIGPYRCLQVEVDGKPFAVWYKLDDYRMGWDEGYMRNVDEMLARQFERMIEKVLKDAVAAVPEGVDLLSDADRG